jgi:hypothetical protein
MTRFEVVIFTWHYGTHKTSGARTAHLGRPRGFCRLCLAFVSCPETPQDQENPDFFPRDSHTHFFDGSCSASQLWSWHWHCARFFQQPF